MANRILKIVLDAGHGGDAPAGGSSPNRASGPAGLLEKDVALELAKRTSRALEGRTNVTLTRSDNRNLSLASRAGVARGAEADLFVSLHWNGSPDGGADGTSAWVARQANARSRALARRLAESVARVTGAPNRGVRERDLGVLLPARHHPGTGACLLEIAYLTNPAQAARLRGPDYLDSLARALADSLVASESLAAGLSLGDDSPLLNLATRTCFGRLEEYSRNATAATNPNVRSATRILSETGVTVDANPYVGITSDEIRAVARAAHYSHQPAEVLLALWAKEGSTQSVTTVQAISQATTEANAKALFRSNVFYFDLGTDHFLETTRSPAGGDNIYDPSDAMAPRHEARFAATTAGLVTAGLLSENIAAAINAELTVARNPAGGFTVLPSNRFYTLSLLLADAYFTQLQRTSYTQIPSISAAMNYLQWNMGPATFRQFLEAAATHGRLPNLENWTLHTTLRAGEWVTPRRNAVRFLFYLESYRPIFAGTESLLRPGAEDLEPTGDTRLVRTGTPPATRTSTGTRTGTVTRGANVGALSNDPITYAGRAYTPATATFRCAPDPPAVIAATLWPNPSTTADEDCRTSLRAVGLTDAEVRTFEGANGFVTLRPFATQFGAAMLTELLRRLRYNAHQFKNPPHSFATPAALRTATGLSPAGVLGVRLLLAIPGHFRELARHTTTPSEAFALENFGWLLMGTIHSQVNRATSRQFWLPEPPEWVTNFGNPLPATGEQIRRLIMRTGLIDDRVGYPEYREREQAWINGLAGQHWKLETGVTASPLGVGQPFYPSIVTIPAQININPQKAQIRDVWTRVLADVDGRHTALTPASTAELTNCGAHNHRLTALRLTQPVSFGGLQLAVSWPLLVPAAGARSTGRATSGTVLRQVHPTAELLFQTINRLGWRDLLFHTAGSFCLRGIKNGTAASARNISDHGFAIAFDMNVFENPQLRQGVPVVPGTMDPRIVKLFEEFHFQWGKCFRPSDLHHFDYN